MPHPLPPLPAELLGRSFTTREARSLGVSEGRMRRADLSAPFRGVRSPTEREDDSREHHPEEKPWGRWERLALRAAYEYSVIAGPAAVFSHTVAARLHGFPLPVRLARDIRVHVSTARQQDRPRMRGVVAHHLPRDIVDPVVRVGLLVTNPVQTWCALAPATTIEELIVLGDHLVRRRNPDATLDELRRAVERSAGRHGARKLRVAIEDVRPRTDSSRETEVRLILVAGGLPEPAINHPILDVHGRLIRHGDMAYPEQKVLVEYDGEQHRTDSAQYRLDRENLDRILAAGWIVVHVLKEHLRHPPVLVARTRAALRSRGA